MLNRNDILSMPAGRELDALVAEKVMGWTSVDMDGEEYFDSPESMRLACDWNPSADIAAAWEVVEKMKKDGYLPCVNFGTALRPHEWHTNFKPDSRTDYDGFADTAMLSICRAALLTTLEQSPE